MKCPGMDEPPGTHDMDVLAGYDHWAPHYDRDANALIELEEPITLELVGDVRGLQVLDLGCGTGRYCRLLAARGARVTGVDASPGMLAEARKQLPPGCQLVQGTLDHLPVPDGAFDLVICALTLNHIQDLAPVLREVARVLRPGGRLILSDFHPYWIVFDRGHTEYFDEAGRLYRIRCYPHLFADYWRLWREHGLQLEQLREPAIDDALAAHFPDLQEHRGLPFALIATLTLGQDRPRVGALAARGPL